jgi:hypothetical protein
MDEFLKKRERDNGDEENNKVTREYHKNSHRNNPSPLNIIYHSDNNDSENTLKSTLYTSNTANFLSNIWDLKIPQENINSNLNINEIISKCGVIISMILKYSNDKFIFELLIKDESDSFRLLPDDYNINDNNFYVDLTDQQQLESDNKQVNGGIESNDYNSFNYPFETNYNINFKLKIDKIRSDEKKFYNKRLNDKSNFEIEYIPYSNAELIISINIEKINRCYKYRGLNNIGETCYMNSLLQLYYMIGYFKKALYNLSMNSVVSDKSFIYNLAKLFYALDNSNSRSIETHNFVDSFNWVRNNLHNQQDVGEFNSKFEEECDKTEIKLAFMYLFKGSINSTIKCIDSDYQSSKSDMFTNLQLTINVYIIYLGLQKYQREYREIYRRCIST